MDMKCCRRCQKTLNVDQFYKNKNGTFGVDNRCKKCDAEMAVEYTRRKSKRLGRAQKYYSLDGRKDRELGLKYCPKCKNKKSLTEFYKLDDNLNGGYSTYCSECTKDTSKQTPKEQLRRYYKNGYRIRRDTNLRRKYGLSLDEYEKMLENQNSCCIICKKTLNDNGKNLAVDHDHKTGKIRGLLCNNCNVAVGFLQDNPEMGNKIADYLKEGE